ncbi:hypothetical protein [Edwardsiella ictaluri]|uniref:hypothetical protein n=1 Tax=Edwardsiella ictaluri TaxID=67780 RepID=UPI00259C787B|nr:hypothetical protein [Edwardsiella ictaluri]
MKRVTSASLLLLLFCWAATAIGKIGAWHSQVITTLPLNQLPCNTAIFSEDDRNPAGGHCLSRIPHNRKITALIRLHICGGSEVARNGLVPPDVPPPESRQPYPPRHRATMATMHVYRVFCCEPYSYRPTKTGWGVGKRVIFFTAGKSPITQRSPKLTVLYLVIR